MLAGPSVMKATLTQAVSVAGGDKHLPNRQHPDPEPGPETADAVARQGQSAHFQGRRQVRPGLPPLGLHVPWGKLSSSQSLPSAASCPGHLLRGRS